MTISHFTDIFNNRQYINLNDTDILVSFSPFLPNKADVELAALQVFPGVAHDLVEGVFQQVVPTNDQPVTRTKVKRGQTKT